ncbi:hypothetical protein A6R68_22515 [Neotoma lepida]|uniref:Uncharacterized protein n=1 Tax=Neotoma lepida TaxID=56216 RepID=A0A1A6I0I4_NEOLE|nr:hypothetical protein A6R68_22515 [Neotoma lepida]
MAQDCDKGPSNEGGTATEGLPVSGLSADALTSVSIPQLQTLGTPVLQYPPHSCKLWVPLYFGIQSHNPSLRLQTLGTPVLEYTVPQPQSKAADPRHP